jgi:hypothetical protein
VVTVERVLERAQPIATEGADGAFPPIVTVKLGETYFVKRAEVTGERAGAAVCADERVEIRAYNGARAAEL